MKISEDFLDDEIIYYEEPESEEEIELSKDLPATNIPLSGSPLYPRIFIGESAKPLQSQPNESEYVDDNISRTWLGLLTSFHG